MSPFSSFGLTQDGGLSRRRREWPAAKPRGLPARAARVAGHEAREPAALDYDEWARVRNDRSAGPRVVRSRVLRNAFPYVWNDLLAIAEGRFDFFEAPERASRAPGDHPFVSRGQLAALLGVAGSLVDYIAVKPDFPAVLAVISGTRVWDAAT